MFQLLVLSQSAFYTKAEERGFLSWMKETSNMFTGEEYYLRLGIWLQNKRYVQEFNAQGHRYQISLNKFAHLTPTEYRSLLGYNPKYRKAESAYYKAHGDLPEEVDWREKGVVNPIQEQGMCGSCWAHSTLQAQESQWAIKRNELYLLSAWELVDCCKFCYGCNGGDMHDAVRFTILNHEGHFMLLSDYPRIYQYCEFDVKKGVTTITGTEDVAPNDEEGLEAIVAERGPAVVGVDSSPLNWQLYKIGIYDDPKCSSTDLNHGVGVVGYGADKQWDEKYWIIRNSFGADWGESGYMRLARGKNRCGVAVTAFVPKIE